MSCYDKALEEAYKDKPNFIKVIDLLKQSIRNENDPRAKYALRSLYLHGKYVESDMKKSYQLLREAADENILEASCELAYFYENGVIVRKNFKTAFQLYLQAALRGNPDAIYEVGRYYYHGVVVEKNKKIADIWFDRAEELGVKNKE